MLDQGKISPYQLFCILAVFLAGSSIVMQNITAAGRDTWISLVLAALIGVGVLMVTTRLAFIFPNQTIIEYSQILFGRSLGKVIGALYIWYFFHLGVIELRNYGEFMTTLIMPETPLWFFQLSFALVVAYLVYQSIEVIGRLSELIFFFGMLTFVIIIILHGLSGVEHIENLLPVLEGGVSRVIKGAVPIAAFPFLELILFTMIFPRVNSPDKIRKAAFWAIFIIGMVLDGILFMELATFGNNMARLTFPGYYNVRMISVGGFIERIDPTLISIYYLCGLIKIGVCFYAFIIGLSQLLGLNDYKPLIIPSAVIMVVLSISVYENTFEMLNFAINIWPIYSIPFQVVFPVLMLIIAKFRKG